MTKREIAVLSFKVASLYALIQGVQALSNAGYYLFASSSRESHDIAVQIVAILGPSVVLFAVSWFVWVYAERLSASLFSAEGAPTRTTGSSASQIQEVAFKVLGLVVLLMALTRLVHLIVSMFAITEAAGFSPRVSVSQYAEGALVLVQLVVGVWLVLGAPRLDEWIQMIRGTYEGPSKQPPGGKA
jgi:hypothetical protein